MLCVLNFMDIHTYTQNVSTYFKYSGTFSMLGALQNTIHIPIDVHVDYHGLLPGDVHILSKYQKYTEEGPRWWIR